MDKEHLEFEKAFDKLRAEFDAEVRDRQDQTIEDKFIKRLESMLVEVSRLVLELKAELKDQARARDADRYCAGPGYRTGRAYLQAERDRLHKAVVLQLNTLIEDMEAGDRRKAQANPKGESSGRAIAANQARAELGIIELNSCGSCKWFDPLSVLPGRVRGQCRRRAPQAPGCCIYPIVFDMSWCGEHEAKPKADRHGQIRAEIKRLQEIRTTYTSGGPAWQAVTRAIIKLEYDAYEAYEAK